MIKLLGIPFDANSSFLKGPAQAPPLIRQMDSDGSANVFSENGLEINKSNLTDLGDMTFENQNPETVYRAIKQRVDRELEDGGNLICLGGDHSISFPIIEAYASHYPGLHVLHFDAHPDLYHHYDNNPFSHASPFARIMEKGLTASLTQVGVRTLTTHLREQGERFRVRMFEMKDLGYDFLQTLQAPLYISIDMDVLDPAFAPGVSHHEPGGMSTRELITMIQSISVPVIGADIVEYNPTRDLHNMTAMVAYKIMKEIAAKMMD